MTNTAVAEAIFRSLRESPRGSDAPRVGTLPGRGVCLAWQNHEGEYRCLSGEDLYRVGAPAGVASVAFGDIIFAELTNAIAACVERLPQSDASDYSGAGGQL
jgi:hypothetical protein